MTVFTNIGQLVTVRGDGAPFRNGAAMRDIGVVENAAVLFDENIRWVGDTADVVQAVLDLGYLPGDIDEVNCEGRVVLPGFVDSHTHMVFAGSRANEFARRLAGTSYAQIAAEGGGILTTMNAVRQASEDDLAAVCERLVTSAMEHGTTTIEIKSGYGLDVESELRLLRAARRVAGEQPARIVTTFLGAHAVPPEYRSDPDAYVDLVIEHMLPAVAREGLAEFCDVFTDVGFFTVEQSERVLTAARRLGMNLKVHADEIGIVGASTMAARMGAISADHLEHSTEEHVLALRDAGVVCTLLPGTAYTLRLPYPNARMMIDQGAIVALASDCNPGSSYTENMQTILSLACAMMSMTIEEAITAATLNGAAALGLADRVGSIEVGKSADLVIYDCHHYADIIYHFGTNQVWSVWAAGEEV
jgi:imidazolonepropionase